MRRADSVAGVVTAEFDGGGGGAVEAEVGELELDHVVSTLVDCLDGD